MIKQSNQSRQVEKYLYYHKNDGSASIFGMIREERSFALINGGNFDRFNILNQYL
jgi:hypothetical protein